MSFIQFAFYFLIMMFILGIKSNIMSCIKEFNDLPITVKAIIISILLFAPFWFMLLYFYFPAILQTDLYEKSMFVAFPVIIWYGMEIIICKNYIPTIHKIFKSEYEEIEVWGLTFSRSL